METQEPNLTLEDSLAQVMQTLPPVIQDFLRKEKYTEITKRLMSKYSLRIDQAGVLERELMLVLMGVDTPDEFIEALNGEARIEKIKINAIVRELNEQVFTPLREAEKKPGEKIEEKGVVRLIVPTQPTFPVVSAEKKESEKHFHLENKIPLPTRPLDTTSAPTTPLVAVPTEALLSVGERVFLSGEKAQSPATLLEDHEEPSPVFKKIEVAPAPPPALLRAVPSRLASSQPKENPENIPTPIPAITMEPMVAAKPILEPTPAPLIKSYGSDPYREPIDEVPGA